MAKKISKKMTKKYLFARSEIERKLVDLRDSYQDVEPIHTSPNEVDERLSELRETLDSLIDDLVSEA